MLPHTCPFYPLKIAHANRQACIRTLTFSDILTHMHTHTHTHTHAHARTHTHTHTYSVCTLSLSNHLHAAGESSPPSVWQSGWQDGRTAPRLAENMTIVQRLALIRPCFAQCIPSRCHMGFMRQRQVWIENYWNHICAFIVSTECIQG